MSNESNSTTVDPRIQIELENLNTATDNINKYEVELDDVKSDFKNLAIESVEKLKQCAQKLSNSIETAKPYYEARLYAGQMNKDLLVANCNYEKSKSIHVAAKEMVYLAEQGLAEHSTLDTACQEMLSHATSRVNESQLECTETRNILKICDLKQEVANNRVAKLQSQLKSAIKASSLRIRRTLLLINSTTYKHDLFMLPYYETRANYNGILKEKKCRIQELEQKIRDAKFTYNDALTNLEKISEEIHKSRNEKLDFNNTVDDIIDSLSDDDLSVDASRFANKSLNRIECNDEYLDFPSNLSTKSSPIRQKNINQLDCPHLLKDFESNLNITIKNDEFGEYSNTLSHASISGQQKQQQQQQIIPQDLIQTDDIDQWTEIRLSNSNSTSSCYSQHSIGDDHKLITTIMTSSAGSGAGGGGGGGGDLSKQLNVGNKMNSENITNESINRNMDDKINKLNRDLVGNGGGGGGGGGGSGGTSKSGVIIDTWITKSNYKTSNSRRQSLDILIDASDLVKDVFTSGFQKVGKTLERRNSESELSPSDTTDFFSFTRSDNKDGLSDEQVENLLLHIDGTDILKNVLSISK